MSNVTNVILSIGHEDECLDVEPQVVPYGLLRAIVGEYKPIREINQWLQERGRGTFGDQITAANVAGGTKGFEARVFVGAFNYLADEEFIDFVLTRRWRYPESVQLFMKCHDEQRFTLYEIGGKVDDDRDASPEETRTKHISHESSIKSAGVLYLLGALVLFVMGGAAIGGYLGEASSIGFGLGLGALGVMQAAVAYGLFRLRRWAVIPATIISSIGLLMVPVGTLINGYILWLIWSAKGRTVLADEYKSIIAATPDVKLRTSSALWIVLIASLLVLAMVFYIAVRS